MTNTAFGSIRTAASSLAGRIARANHARKTARIIAGLPDETLKDIGYERDRRGDIVVLPDGFR